MGLIQKYITDPIRAEVVQIRKAVVDEIRAQIPVLTKVVVLAIAEGLSEFAENKVDEVTDAIPGQLDDQIIDPLSKRIFDTVRRLGW